MKNSEVLNDLIEINNDRVKGYEKAYKETDDEDLHALFADMAAQSRRFSNELKQYVIVEGEQPAKGTTLKGKIYRVWMDLKATFSGDDRKSVLAACEFGEDAAKGAYETALKSEGLLTEVRDLITVQLAALRKSHDTVKAMRDAQPA